MNATEHTTEVPPCQPDTLGCTPIEPCPILLPPCNQTYVPQTNCPPATVCPQPSTLCPPPQPDIPTAPICCFTHLPGGPQVAAAQAQAFAVHPTPRTHCYACWPMPQPGFTRMPCSAIDACPSALGCTFAGCQAQAAAALPQTHVAQTNCPPATVCPQPSPLCPPPQDCIFGTCVFTIHTPPPQDCIMHTCILTIHTPPPQGFQAQGQAQAAPLPRTTYCPPPSGGTICPTDICDILQSLICTHFPVCNPATLDAQATGAVNTAVGCLHPTTWTQIHCPIPLQTPGPQVAFTVVDCPTRVEICPTFHCTRACHPTIVAHTFQATCVCTPNCPTPNCPTPNCPTPACTVDCPTANTCPPKCPYGTVDPQAQFAAIPQTVICPTPPLTPGCPFPFTQPVWCWSTPRCPIRTAFCPISRACQVQPAQGVQAQFAAAPQDVAVAHTPATVCTQLGCPTYPAGDCTFFGGCQTHQHVCTVPPGCPDPRTIHTVCNPCLTVQSQCGPCLTQPPPCLLTQPHTQCPTSDPQHCFSINQPCITQPHTQCPTADRLHCQSINEPCLTQPPPCDVWTPRCPTLPRTCHPAGCLLTAPPQCPIKTDPVACGPVTFGGCVETPQQGFQAMAAAAPPLSLAPVPCHTQMPACVITHQPRCPSAAAPCPTQPQHTCGPTILPCCLLTQQHPCVSVDVRCPTQPQHTCGPTILPCCLLTQQHPCPSVHGYHCPVTPPNLCPTPSAQITQCECQSINEPCISPAPPCDFFTPRCPTLPQTCHPAGCLLTAPPQCPIKTDPAACGPVTFGGCVETPQQQVAARAPLTPPAQGVQALQPVEPIHTWHTWCTRLHPCFSQQTCIVTCNPQDCFPTRQVTCLHTCTPRDCFFTPRCPTLPQTCHPAGCLLTAPPQCPIKTDPAACGPVTFGGCVETPQQQVAARAMAAAPQQADVAIPISRPCPLTPYPQHCPTLRFTQCPTQDRWHCPIDTLICTPNCPTWQFTQCPTQDRWHCPIDTLICTPECPFDTRFGPRCPMPTGPVCEPQTPGCPIDTPQQQVQARAAAPQADLAIPYTPQCPAPTIFCTAPPQCPLFTSGGPLCPIFTRDWRRCPIGTRYCPY